MSRMPSQITSLTIAYSTVYSSADQKKHQSSASLAFVRGIHRWPVNSPHKGPATGKMFPFDNVIMIHASVVLFAFYYLSFYWFDICLFDRILYCEEQYPKRPARPLQRKIGAHQAHNFSFYHAPVEDLVEQICKYVLHAWILEGCSQYPIYNL